MSPVTLYLGLHPFVHSACCKQCVSQNPAAHTTACCLQLQASRSEHSPVCIRRVWSVSSPRQPLGSRVCACRELGQNLLKELPLEVSQLQCLKKLGLPSNLLKTVPPQVAGLEVLEWL